MPVKLTRHLPGKATHRDEFGKVRFEYGIVADVGRNSILVKTSSREIGQVADHGYIRLIGETYIYWCPRCQTSVWEQERISSAGACPHCKQGLWALQAGDKVRLHYRVSLGKNVEGQLVSGGGAWWGEKVV